LVIKQLSQMQKDNLAGRYLLLFINISNLIMVYLNHIIFKMLNYVIDRYCRQLLI